MTPRRPNLARRSPVLSAGVASAGRSMRAVTRTVVGAIVVLAVAFGGPVHLWLAHGGEGHAAGPVAGPGTASASCTHAGHHGHRHTHPHDHVAHAGGEGHDHGGHDHPGPCQDPVEECDLCLAISFSAPLLAATVEVPGATAEVEMAAFFRGTSRDIWGPATASSRGPPRRA